MIERTDVTAQDTTGDVAVAASAAPGAGTMTGTGRPVGGRAAVSWFAAASGLVGVAGLAITQPVLDLFGRNPEFFIAGRYGSGQIVTFALVVGLVPGLVAVALSTGARLVHRRLGTIVHVALLAALAFLFGLVLAGHVGMNGVWSGSLWAAAVAGVVVWLERTRQPMRTLLSYLALGNLVFVALFLFASPTAELVMSRADAVSGDGGVGPVPMPELRGPVVLVILDEFPVTTIMRPDGTINAARYPNFARLAASSTWFRNASALSSLTSQAVPAMLTGRRHDPDDLPSYIDHPRSYFTLFGDRYPVNLYESVTDMCPPSVCAPARRGSVGTALEDGLVVYGRQVLPGDLADDLDLPSVDHSWGSFGAELDLGTGGDPGATTTTTSSDSGSGSPAEVADGILGENGYGRWQSLSPDERRASGQLEVLLRSVTRIGPEPTVNFVHVALPH